LNGDGFNDLVTANEGSNNISALLGPFGVPDLTITKTHSGTFQQGQTGATYSLTVTNTGSTPTSGMVTVADMLPSGLSATAISGAGWNCTVATLVCQRSDVLAPASSYPAITLTVSVAGNAASTLTNTAVVSGGGEVKTSNDTAQDPTTIVPSTQLTCAANVGSSLSVSGSGFSYNFGTGRFVQTVTLTNNSGVTISGPITLCSII